ncbi:MAG TPA: type II secretion system F family protein [Nocardioidaceae bacterium]|jgi:Flp pilus assembly protein TadB|nr:type II secretion system F family protein [Nocardioidaceae bacterium]
MTLILVAGALAGLGVLTLVLQLDRGSGTGAAELARLDAARQRVRREAGLGADRRHQAESMRMRRLGALLRDALESRGWQLPAPLRADLAVMGRSVETHLASTVMTAVAGLFAPTIMLAPSVYFFGTSPTTPVWLALLGALVAGLLPTLQLRSTAADRRRDFRHVVSAFLDLVAMNLAGGRGVPEALSSAVSISDGWAMVRIRDTLQTARLQGITPWAALGELGEEMAVEELRDLAATLALVAEDGAKVRDSLQARAGSMRQRELADAESRAAARSQSMLIAQLLLCVGFLLFLTYPAISQILGI